jgi:hypothetical protein
MTPAIRWLRQTAGTPVRLSSDEHGPIFFRRHIISRYTMRRTPATIEAEKPLPQKKQNALADKVAPGVMARFTKHETQNTKHFPPPYSNSSTPATMSSTDGTQARSMFRL